MPKTKDVRSRFTKQLLRNTMQKMVVAKGFEAVTVNNLCIEADLSRTTFYQHYEDKYDLMVDCIRELVLVPNPLEESGDLEAFFRHVLRAMQENKAVLTRLGKVTSSMELKVKMDKMFVRAFAEYFNNKYPSGKNPEGVPGYMLAIYHCHGTMQLISNWEQHNKNILDDSFIKYLSKQLEEA